MKALKVSIALILAASFSAACGSNQATSGNPNEAASAPPAASAAATLFQSTGCVFCHGADGKGNAQMKTIPNFTDAAWQKKTEDAEMINTIKNGKPSSQPPMPAYQKRLTDEQISALVAYVRSFAQQ